MYSHYITVRRKHMQMFRCSTDGACYSYISQMRFDIAIFLNKIVSELFKSTRICFVAYIYLSMFRHWMHLAIFTHAYGKTASKKLVVSDLLLERWEPSRLSAATLSLPTINCIGNNASDGTICYISCGCTVYAYVHIQILLLPRR